MREPRQVVRFNTFESERNQGFVVHLGDIEVFVDRASITATRRKHCTSDELVTEVANVVTLDGRSFLATKSGLWKVGDPELEVTLPYGFVPTVVKNQPKFCTKCGHKI
jgi:hypothetical protein